VCDSYVRPETLVRICDECNFGTYGGRCIICGAPGKSRFLPAPFLLDFWQVFLTLTTALNVQDWKRIVTDARKL
jgi:hypothetical protein